MSLARCPVCTCTYVPTTIHRQQHCKTFNHGFLVLPNDVVGEWFVLRLHFDASISNPTRKPAKSSTNFFVHPLVRCTHVPKHLKRPRDNVNREVSFTDSIFYDTARSTIRCSKQTSFMNTRGARLIAKAHRSRHVRLWLGFVGTCSTMMMKTAWLRLLVSFILVAPVALSCPPLSISPYISPGVLTYQRRTTEKPRTSV